MLEPITLFGHNPIGLLGPRPHELDAAAGDDVGLEFIVLQIADQFLHRLVGQIGVFPFQHGVLGRSDPVRDDLREFVGAHAGMGNHDGLQNALLAGLGEGLLVAVHNRLERRFVVPLRMLGRHRFYPGESEHRLSINRPLDPERAVVVECCNALLGRHEIGVRLVGNLGDEIDDRRFPGTVVPGLQNVLGGCVS